MKVQFNIDVDRIWICVDGQTTHRYSRYAYETAYEVFNEYSRKGYDCEYKNWTRY